MRLRSWHMLVFIILVTLIAGYISLPRDVLNIAGTKDDITVHEGLDLQGGLQVLLRADPPAGREVDSETLAGTRDTIERRVNGLGVSEPVIQTRGSDQIIVELPGIDDPEAAVETLQQTALLEIIDPQGQFLPEGSRVRTQGTEARGDSLPDASPAATPGASPSGSPGATPEAGTPAVSATPTPTGPIYTTVVTGSQLTDAFVTQDQTGRPVVGFELNAEGGDAFYQFTSSNIGQPMSVVLDGVVISSPVVRAAIDRQGTIEGPPLDEVKRLVIQLKSGALDVPLVVESSRTVGPTLGRDSIDRSIVAGIVGLGIVALFMIIYYRLPGVLSVVALGIYTLISFALFKTIPVTLTLAGIAGFILSIGMAVDANILIFARLKDELRVGRQLSMAIEDGFNHAWPSIRDSNVSTMITCAILYWFGTYTGASIITGFAITLFVGVAVSMFTAITVSRTLLRLMVDAGLANHPWWFGVDVARPSQPASSPAD